MQFQKKTYNAYWQMLQNDLIATFLFELLILFMANFFKDSIRELKHVVWPTRKETSNYFTIVLIILTLFGIYLFIASTIFSEAIVWLKNLI